MPSKEVLMQVKEAIIRLKNQNRPIREIAETLGGPNQQIGTFLKRRNALASSATPKGLGDHRKQLQWMIAEFFSY